MTEAEHKAKILRERQMACKHGFIKGPADVLTRCVHCGVSSADWDEMNPAPLAFAYPWSSGFNGIP